MPQALPAKPSGQPIYAAARSHILADRLPPSGAIRLERLRGFGAPLGTLMTCGCWRFDFADGVEGVLIVAAEPVGRAMPIAPGATQPVHVMQDVADRASPAPAEMAAEPATQNVAAPGDLPTVEYERAALSGEAPAEFALIDEFADTPEIAATDFRQHPARRTRLRDRDEGGDRTGRLAHASAARFMADGRARPVFSRPR